MCLEDVGRIPQSLVVDMEHFLGGWLPPTFFCGGGGSYSYSAATAHRMPSTATEALCLVDAVRHRTSMAGEAPTPEAMAACAKVKKAFPSI